METALQKHRGQHGVAQLGTKPRRVEGQGGELCGFARQNLSFEKGVVSSSIMWQSRGDTRHCPSCEPIMVSMWGGIPHPNRRRELGTADGVEPLGFS